jgi:hypothetical protein
MPWIRIDDHFDEHPKLAAVSPVGWGVWLAGLAYCNRNLTDGFIPYSVAEGIGGSWRVRIPVDDHTEVWTIDRGSGMHGETMDTQWVIDLLIGVGLWEEVSDGYQVHDYGDFQPTKAQVLAARAVKVAAGQAGGLASAKARAKARRRPRAKPPAVALVDADAEAESNPKPVPKPKPTPVPVSVKGLHGVSPLEVGSARGRVDPLQ